MKFTFTHNNFNVTDLDKSLAFYKEALGLVEVRRKVATDNSFILVFLGDGVSKHQLEPYYVDYIEKKVVNDYLTPEIPIVQGSMDVYTGARGAASLVTKRVVELTFHTPDTWHLEQ